MKTDVIFRIWPSGEIEALLPEMPALPGNIGCYAHIGQHAEASYPGIIWQTRPATPEEYQELKNEMENLVGYDLNVKKRVQYKKLYWVKNKK